MEERIKQLPLRERIYLKAFFEEAIKYDQAAHVLYFMNKPVCLTGPVLKSRHKIFKDILILKGWLAFKKYQRLFPHPHFIFSENISASDEDFKVLHIYIINKQSIIACLEKHLHLFRNILGSEFSAEQFISKLEQGDSLPALLKGDEMLLGILLGFGEESSKAFKETVDNHTGILAPPPTDSYQCIHLKRPKGCRISPVVFMGNPCSKEVQKLCATYESELETIWKLYKASPDPLKMVLEQLCQDPSTNVTDGQVDQKNQRIG